MTLVQSSRRIVGELPPIIDSTRRTHVVDLTQEKVAQTLKNRGAISEAVVTVSYRVREMVERRGCWLMRILCLIFGCGRTRYETRVLNREITVLNPPDKSKDLRTIFNYENIDIRYEEGNETEFEARYNNQTNRLELICRVPNREGNVFLEEEPRITFADQTYDEEGAEVKAFLDCLHTSSWVAEHYTEEDFSFLKKEVIPKLLSAQHYLTLYQKELQREDPIRTTVSVTSKNCSYLRVDPNALNALSATSFLKHNLAAMPISVKVHPSGHIIYHLPIPKREGGTKQSRLTVAAHISNPMDFRIQVKQSIRKEHLENMETTRKSSYHEMITNEILFPNRHPHPNIGCKPNLLVSSKYSILNPQAPVAQSAYFDEMVPLSSFKRNKQASVSSKEVRQIMQNTYNAMIGAIQGAKKLHETHLHNDYKGDNILVSTKQGPNKQLEVIAAKVHDFGLARPKGRPLNQQPYGTKGYYLENQPQGLSSDIYGLGRAFYKFIRNYISGDLQIEDGSKEQQERLKSIFYEAEQELIGLTEKMTKTMKVSVQSLDDSDSSSGSDSYQEIYDNCRDASIFFSLLQTLRRMQTKFIQSFDEITASINEDPTSSETIEVSAE